mmetsp:Transcript_2991/g.2837  ORF Transcript_2991/g.2837 Transcript_2991/m.2837 type:complete len:94 (+) Transcript_2991:1764-2045(+)
MLNQTPQHISSKAKKGARGSSASTHNNSNTELKKSRVQTTQQSTRSSVEREKKIEMKKKGNSLGKQENYDNYMVNTFLNTVGKKYEVSSPIQA